MNEIEKMAIFCTVDDLELLLGDVNKEIAKIEKQIAKHVTKLEKIKEKQLQILEVIGKELTPHSKD